MIVVFLSVYILIVNQNLFMLNQQQEYNPDSLNKSSETEKNNKKKMNMSSIFVIPESSKYKKQIIKREKETKKLLKERELNKTSQTRPSFPLKSQ